MQTFFCPTLLMIIPKVSFFFIFLPVLWDYLSRTLPSLVSYVQSLIFTSTLIARQWGLGPLFPFLLTRETESKTKCKDKWWKTRERNKRRYQKVCTHGKCWQQSQSFPFTPHLPCRGSQGGSPVTNREAKLGFLSSHARLSWFSVSSSSYS